MQLVAYGAQDVYLSGKPQITFWKLMYRRHTNFAIESIEQVFNGTAGFGKKASATISRNGDLITHVFLQLTAPQLRQPYTEGLSDYYDTVDGELTIKTVQPNYYARYVNSFAHAMIESCEIEIGGQRIDKHYSNYYEVLDELTCPEEKREGYGRMIGKIYDNVTSQPMDDPGTEETNAKQYRTLDTHMGQHGNVTFYVPMRFWFNSNPGLALPLIALQYHEVKLQFSFRKLDDLVNFDVGLGLNQLEYGGKSKMSEIYTKLESKGPNIATEYVVSSGTGVYFADSEGSATRYTTPISTVDSEELTVGLYVDYVYLDTDERRRFAQVSHEYLIEQLQFTGVESFQAHSGTTRSEKVRLNFNHPCKELIFFVQREADKKTNKHFDFGEGSTACTAIDDKVCTYAPIKGHEHITTAKLLLNGHDRFTSRQGSYFRMVVPFQVHTRVPSRHIYCYSFGLRPEEHQPSGSCNFSRIDNASLHIELAKSAGFDAESVSLTVYAINYNVLRIMSGMGGLAYSN